MSERRMESALMAKLYECVLRRTIIFNHPRSLVHVRMKTERAPIGERRMRAAFRAVSFRSARAHMRHACRASAS